MDQAFVVKGGFKFEYTFVKNFFLAAELPATVWSFQEIVNLPDMNQ